MATTVAAQLAKGPLSSTLGQWLFIGFGTVVIFTGENGVSKAAQDIAKIAFKIVTGQSGDALLKDAALSSQHLRPQQPIVIHNIAPSERSGSYSSRYGWGTLIQLTMGAGACWAGYVVFSQLLPDSLKELLPVTRKFFDKAITSLGQGIIRVRDVLSEQIAVLGVKQDELSAKQDSTHAEVLGIKDNVEDVMMAISRCEESLVDATGRQTYMSRGVRLLVHCVGDLLRGSNPAVAEELDRFSQLNAELDDDFDYRGAPSMPNKYSSRPDYPSSPNISEISGSHTAAEEIRPLSLPKPRPSRSPVPPTNSGTHMISPQFGRSPSLPLASNTAFLSMRKLSRQGSSPENEVPGPEKVSLDDVDEVLRLIRSGQSSSVLAQA